MAEKAQKCEQSIIKESEEIINELSLEELVLLLNEQSLFKINERDINNLVIE